jgi:hypothetical protein
MTDAYSNPQNKPVIATLAIGTDYVKALKTCLESKQAYADKHGYLYVQAGEQYWDRFRPIAWSKIPFLLDLCNRLPEGTLIWLSDADVLITNPDLTIEDQMVSLLPQTKDMLMSLDACGHINSGNILFRNTAWSRDFWKRTGEMKQFTYHPWWENAAINCLWENNTEDYNKIEISRQHKKFNAYIRGMPDEQTWKPGDFLVHFAGVYNLQQMEVFANQCLAGEAPDLKLESGEIEACMASRYQTLQRIKKMTEAQQQQQG